MPAHDDARRRHPVLRRTRVLLWCQLAAGLAGTAACAGALYAAGPLMTVSGWGAPAFAALVCGGAATLLGYLSLAGRPRRAVLVAVLLAPAVCYVAGSALSLSTTAGALPRAEFGWFAYAPPGASTRLFQLALPLLNAALWLTFLGVLLSLANAVRLVLPSAREAFEPDGPGARPRA
ncbi:hypothetical protein FZ103_24095 [Streptomonospora sp. PA3]|uniref:hypothetical protein n=1 Tax=Streptomonospora sp. PA3 TaxID=2607326 RepID=UPI0012DD457D|nr:hypothetical protein [Streptomonospora sp. PA3]MUL44205.1 hypothetical protein [Streptomonospora sp. PA3]